MKVTGMLAAVGVALAIGLGGPTSASAHSGGLDGNGCHAGSQPYHCHNGGSGGSSGGSSGGGSSSSSSGSTSVPTGPSPAQLAAIDNAESAVDRSRTELAQSRTHVAKVADVLASAEEKLDVQREDVNKLRTEIDDLEVAADRLREERLDDRAAAAKRVSLVAATNRDLAESHKTDRRALGYMAGLFGGFLLLGLVRTLAAVLAISRPILLTGALAGAVVFGVIGFAVPSAPIGILVSLVGGLVLSVAFMLARVWWVPFALPKFVGFGLLAVAAFMAVGSVGAAMTATPPAAEQPAAEDAALVAEQEADPDAAEFQPAVEAEEEAADLASDLKELDAGLEAQQARIEALRAKLSKAEAAVDVKESEVDAAKDHLATLR